MSEQPLNKKFPIFTILLTLTTLTFYFLLSYLSGSYSVNYALFEKFGAPYAVQIYEGQYWGVVVNSLIHAFPLHLLTNLLGLWVFGAFLERRIGTMRFFIFGLVSSIFTSLIQLTLTNDAGLGLTGVNFALFGLIFVLAFSKERYKMKFHIASVLFMVCFMAYSIYMNFNSDWYIGIQAQISGLFWGVLVGLSVRIKSVFSRVVFLSIPFVFSVCTLFYAPWSSMWETSRAIGHHESGNLELASLHYKKALEIEPSNKIALENLKRINVDKLAKLAYRCHKSKDYITAHRYYLQILALDKNNVWARTNMRHLP